MKKTSEIDIKFNTHFISVKHCADIKVFYDYKIIDMVSLTETVEPRSTRMYCNIH